MVLPCEDLGRCDLLGLFLGELTTPGHALQGLGAGATVVVFQVTGRLFTLFLPMVPPFGTDMGAQVTVHEEGVARVAPGTSEIDLVDTCFRDEPAVVEDIAIGGIGRCGGGGDVAVDETLDGAVLKPGGGGAEDEVGGAADVTALEVKSCVGHACVNGVLMTDQLAVDKDQAVAFGVQGYGLSETGGVVLDGEVFQGDVVGLDLEGVGTEGTHFIDIGVVVVGDDGLVAVLATEFDVLEPLGDDEFFLIGTFLYIDDFVVVHEGAADFYGFVDGTELAGAVARHDDRIGIVVSACGRSE